MTGDNPTNPRPKKGLAVPPHLARDLEALKKDILAVGALVENALLLATTALLERRSELARQVIEGDAEIDRREVVIEDQCLKILALHQPVASGLRFIITVLKVNNDLERMGDLAVNIAERALDLGEMEPLRGQTRLEDMIERVRSMVNDSLSALVELDVDVARRVLRSDDEVDELNRQMFAELQQVMLNDPGSIERAMHVLSASRNLERVADQATNVAEDVLFMVEGDIVRHRDTQIGEDRTDRGQD